ncbi:rCG30335 [Rattus norvegicus]|nr:rCG30335 [Rattus norvegicus]
MPAQQVTPVPSQRGGILR